MPSLRLFAGCVAVLFSLATAQAQTGGEFLPNEGELNRLGLTMAWWAHAAVNPRKDRVEFFTADEQDVYVQSTTGIVSTYHGELGRKMWTQLVGEPDQQAYPITTSDQEVLVTIGLHLYSLDKATGRILWELIVPEYPSTSPQVDDNHIFVGTLDGSVLAYELPKVQNLYTEGLLPQWTVRARLWNFQTPQGIISPPIPSGDNVLFASARGVLYSVSAKSKELRFELETSRVQTPLGFSKDKVFIADINGRMVCINQLNGHVLWTFSGGNVIRQQPRVVDGQVFVVPLREGLTSIAVTNGVVQWQQRLAVDLLAVSESHVYASDESNNLLILDRKTGGLIGLINMRNFPVRVTNDRTDRLYLCSRGGTVIGLREIGSEYPVYHLHPERRPILPELAPEEEAPATEASPASEKKDEAPADENATGN